MLKIVTLVSIFLCFASGSQATDRVELDKSEIILLQQLLNMMNYPTLDDGIWGPSSQKSLEKYYSDNGGRLDGVINRNELDDLLNAIENQISNRNDTRVVTSEPAESSLLNASGSTVWLYSFNTGQGPIKIEPGKRSPTIHWPNTGRFFLLKSKSWNSCFEGSNTSWERTLDKCFYPFQYQFENSRSMYGVFCDTYGPYWYRGGNGDGSFDGKELSLRQGSSKASTSRVSCYGFNQWK